MGAPSTAERAVLALRQVVKRFGTATALAGLELELGAGEAVALVGPSGCGKTTALRMLNGLLLPDAGSVEVDEKPLQAAALVEHRRRTGYVIQDVGLLPHWTVRRNIGTVLELRGEGRAAIDARVRELLEAVGLSQSLAERQPAQLSGGQRQRVGIARALAGRPRFLLMDEPFGALDPLTRLRLRQLVARLRRESTLTVVLVTHDLDDARALADRVCVMRQGRLVEELPSNKLESAHDSWVREFLAPGGAGSQP